MVTAWSAWRSTRLGRLTRGFGSRDWWLHRGPHAGGYVPQVFARTHKLKAFGDIGRNQIDDAVDQFDHLSAMADGEKENLQATIDFYRARTNTQMTIAAERLAVIA